MKIDFLTLELSKFTEQLIDCSEKIENSSQNKSEILMIFNRLNFYIEEFFVKNELHFQNQSVELTDIKVEQENFIKTVQSCQMNFIENKTDALKNLVNFIKNWVEKFKSLT